MTISKIFKKIREPWIKEISDSLNQNGRSSRQVTKELNHFFDLLLPAIDHGHVAALKPIIIEWVAAHSEIELEESFFSFPLILNKVVELTSNIAKKHLDPVEALDLIQALMPVFTYAYETVTSREVLIRINYFSIQMEKIQSDLEKIDKSKSDFIAVAAHELRTPLTLIEGYTSMLEEKYSEDGSESPVLPLIKGINNGTRRLEEIVDDMIDVSMIDNNLLILKFQPTWLNQLFEILEDDVESFINDRNQSLEIKEFAGSKEMIFADSERIYQAIRNLVTNAIKYTPDGGEIIVDGQVSDGVIEVSVKDNGIGIAKEHQSQIFQKFGGLGEVDSHSSGKTKFKGGGPGLGLPITKGIIEAHGGKIWVESDGHDEDKCPGSTFYIHIPLRKDPPDDKVAKLFKPKSEN